MAVGDPRNCGDDYPITGSYPSWVPEALAISWATELRRRFFQDRQNSNSDCTLATDSGYNGRCDIFRDFDAEAVLNPTNWPPTLQVLFKRELDEQRALFEHNMTTALTASGTNVVRLEGEIAAAKVVNEDLEAKLKKTEGDFVRYRAKAGAALRQASLSALEAAMVEARTAAATESAEVVADAQKQLADAIAEAQLERKIKEDTEKASKHAAASAAATISDLESQLALASSEWYLQHCSRSILLFLSVRISLIVFFVCII